MSRWLGIDLGAKRIGLAVANAADRIATPLEVLDAVPLERAVRRILELAEEYGVDGVVVGWPLNMDDTEGPQGKLARRIAQDLADATSLDVRLFDERLSSFQADQALRGIYTRKQKKARQDALAAATILLDFLQQDGPRTAPTPRQASERTESD